MRRNIRPVSSANPTVRRCMRLPIWRRIIEREQDFHPDRYIYVVDKRQELHFIQVFRVAKKAGIVKEDTPMIFLGFGTDERQGRWSVQDT